MKFGLINKFNKLFSKSGAPALRASDTLPPATTRPAAALGYAIVNDLPAIYRTEIVDRHKRLCGYLFALKYLQQGRSMSESLFFEVMQGSGLLGFATRRLAVIPIELERMDVARYGIFRSTRAYLQVDLRLCSQAPAQLLKRLLEIRATGAKIALVGGSMNQTEMDYLKAVHMVILDLAEFPLPQFEKIVSELRTKHPTLKLVAENVATWPEYRMCVAWGMSYCIGSFMTSFDAEESRGELHGSHLIAIEMLNLLRKEGDLAALAEVAKRDPRITLKLLGWANSPANALATTITSLAQAIVILGREELYRWLMVSMFRMGRHQLRSASVLEIALARARLMETLPTAQLNKAQREELFLVGLLSLFDIVLDAPMEQILSRIHLPATISEVLLHSGGPYARYLSLAIMLEKSQDAQAANLSETLAIPFKALLPVQMAAFNWSQTALGIKG